MAGSTKWTHIFIGIAACIAVSARFVDSSINSTPEDNFVQKILQEHNDLRREYGNVPELELDPALNDQAKQEAVKKANAYATTGVFPAQQDIQDRNFNDNTWVFLAFSTIRLNASRVLEDWKAQGKIHNFKENIFDWKTAHFTQMVWRSTEKIGVAFADGRTDKGKYITVVVLRYFPPGNVLDKDAFADNVNPR